MNTIASSTTAAQLDTVRKAVMQSRLPAQSVEMTEQGITIQNGHRAVTLTASNDNGWQVLLAGTNPSNNGTQTFPTFADALDFTLAAF